GPRMPDGEHEEPEEKGGLPTGTRVPYSEVSCVVRSHVCGHLSLCQERLAGCRSRFVGRDSEVTLSLPNARFGAPGMLDARKGHTDMEPSTLLYDRNVPAGRAQENWASGAAQDRQGW